MRRTILLMALTGALIGCQSLADHNFSFSEGQGYHAKTIEQLKVGMSQSDVLALMGSPLYDDVLDTRRWYYVTHSLSRFGDNSHHITVQFDAHDKVEKIDKA